MPNKDHSGKTDQQLVAYSLRCMYGYGAAQAEAKAAEYDEATVKQMAAHEREGRRDKIPAIIAAVAAKPKPKSEPAGDPKPSEPKVSEAKASEPKKSTKSTA
jgi:hypothetical protein